MASRRLILTLSFVLPLGGCAGLRGADPEGRPRSSPAGQASGTDADVVCDGSVTRLTSGTVEARADGVHVTIDNVSDVDMGFEYRTEEGGGGGENADRGLTDLLLTVSPGGLGVRCSAGVTDAGSDEGWADLEIKDPGGFWVSPDLDCQGGTAVSGSDSYAGPPKGDPREPVEIGREFFEPKPGDEVLAAGYPEGERRTVILVRDGRTIAAVDYVDASFGGGKSGSGWIEDGYEACDDWQ